VPFSVSLWPAGDEFKNFIRLATSFLRFPILGRGKAVSKSYGGRKK